MVPVPQELAVRSPITCVGRQMAGMHLVDFFWADDARQNNPSRPGMGPLVAAGGVHVPVQAAPSIEAEINTLCADYRFPEREVFKWSPDRKLWMHGNLTGRQRRQFFLDLFDLAHRMKVKAVVVVEDTTSSTATRADSAEIDVTRLLLERVNSQFGRSRTKGILIFDRPGGGRKSEGEFLTQCFDTLDQGTDYVSFQNISYILSAHSRFQRLVQLADVVTSCTLAAVGGECRYSPPVFEAIRGILARDGKRIGGTGLKIHPDGRYANLYHWLVEDSYLGQFSGGHRLPLDHRPYACAPDSP